MDPQVSASRLELANQIFVDALERPAAERLAFVSERCGANPSLANSVMNLLARYGSLGDFLEVPVLSAGSSDVSRFVRGEVLGGRFRIVAEIGRGGMGEVYRAEDVELNETVALKVLRARFRGNESMDARFRDEIRLARKIAQPNVCRIFDLFLEQAGGAQVLYFTMEYLAGPTLAKRLTEGPLGAGVALRIARQVAAGLDAAHALGIVHRDLKPANIILVPEKDGSERAVITDFGLAKVLDAAGATGGQTAVGQILGTPDYMAPEQFLGEEVTCATDVFSMGLIIFEMVAGRKAFPSENPVRSAVRRMLEAPDATSLLAAGVPAQWSRAIARALASNPKQRYPSAASLVDALAGPGTILGRLSSSVVSRRAILSAAGTVIAVSLYFGILRFIRWNPKLPEKPLLMLTPITHSTDTPDGPLSAHALDELLANQLQQSRYVETLSRERIQAAWNRITGNTTRAPEQFSTSQAREVAMRAGAQFVVFGNLARVGDEHVLQLKLELMGNDTGSPRKSWPSNEPRNFSVRTEVSIPSAVHAGADWLRTIAGESFAEVAGSSRPPEELTTSSWQAFREYTQANLAWMKGNAEDAIDHLKVAIKLDPDFALAHARLADILIALERTDEGLPYYSIAAESIRKKNLTDRESLRIRGMFALDTGENAEAAQIFTRYALEYPDDGLPLFYKSSAVGLLGRDEEALQLTAEAMHCDPVSTPFLLNHAVQLLGAGHAEEAEKLCRKAAALNATDGVDHLRAVLALHRMDSEAAWQSLEHLRAQGLSPQYRSKAWSLEACLRAEQGRWTEAEDLVHQGTEFVLKMGLGNQEVFAKKRLLARIHARLGRRAGAVQLCREMLALDPGYEGKLQTGCLLAQCGEINSARACRISGLPAWPLYLHWAARLEGELALAEGRRSKALALLRAAPPASFENEWPEWLLRAELAEGDASASIQLVRALLKRFAWYWYQADVNGPGFLSWAIDLAGSLSLPATDLALAGRIREALNKSTSYRKEK
jgi:serine/threonine protein kinase/tetratricopeptide (TPR) repeat protein